MQLWTTVLLSCANLLLASATFDEQSKYILTETWLGYRLRVPD